MLFRSDGVYNFSTKSERTTCTCGSSFPYGFRTLVELDLGRRELRKNGEPVSLTTGEFAVLKAFARHPRVPLSRDKLMEMARGREYEAFDRSLDVQVSRLRKLIEPDPSKPRYLQTVWGLGYVFIPDDPQDANKA